MKKQLFFLLLILVFPAHNLHALQFVRDAVSPHDIQAKLQEKRVARAQIRKALYMRCGLTLAMLATAFGCGLAVLNNVKISHAPLAVPVKVAPPVQTAWSWFVWRPTPVVAPPPPPLPVLIQPKAGDYFGMAKLVGLVGSAFGALKNIGPCWQQIVQFGSLKRDTNALLVAQKELLDEQKQHGIAQAVTQQMLKEKEACDTERWNEQKSLLDSLHKKLDNAQEELKLLMSAGFEQQSKDAHKQMAMMQQMILELTAQIAELVKCSLHQPPEYSH